jgi:hypothetical protein
MGTKTTGMPNLTCSELCQRYCKKAEIIHHFAENLAQTLGVFHGINETGKKLKVEGDFSQAMNTILFDQLQLMVIRVSALCGKSTSRAGNWTSTFCDDIWPLPLINVLPAVTIALLAIAYLQEDGVLLAVSFVIGILSLLIFGFLIWNLHRRLGSPVRSLDAPALAKGLNFAPA